MKRSMLILMASLLLPAFLKADEPGLKQTIGYVWKLQRTGPNAGGFLPVMPSAAASRAPVPTLRATSSAIRALHYLGGEVANEAACIKFVERCHDAATGGFSDVPMGKPNVFSTAVGLMAVTELKMPMDKYAPGAIKFLGDHAKSFEDIRIAAAGLESIKAKSPKNEAWLKEVLKLQNPDGTYGQGAGQARATGGSVVAVLRLGGTPANVDKVLDVLKKGQRQNGGYGKAEEEIASDLETTYRVMRCFHMLKAQPKDVEGIRSFVAKCRNADGGYGVAPGQPSSVSGTYFAAIVLHWLKEK